MEDFGTTETGLRATLERSPVQMPQRRPRAGDVEVSALRTTLKEHPVRLAVLFGSTVGGDRHPQSDVDVAVEFEDSVTAADRTDTILSLIADLSSALDRNDIDLSLVGDLEPHVGLAAFTNGLLLVGSADRMARHRDRFERAVAAGGERPSLRERFDAVVDAADDLVDSSPR